MPKPPECTTELYEQVMLKTWAAAPEERPTFESLHSFFEEYYNMTESNYRLSNSFDSPDTRSPERPADASVRARNSPARRNAAGVSAGAVAGQLRSLGNVSGVARERDRSAAGAAPASRPTGTAGTHNNPIIT